MSTQGRELPSRRLSNTLKVFILSPIVLLFGSAIRLLIISNYDPSTAGSISSLGGVTGTLLGTLVPLIPPFFPVVAICLFLLRMWKSLFVVLLGMAIVVPAYAGVSESLKVGWGSVVNLWYVIDPEKRAAVWPSVMPTLIFAVLVIAFLVFDHFSPWRERIRSQFSAVDQIRQQRERAEPTTQEDDNSEEEEDQPVPSRVDVLLEHLFVLAVTAIFAIIPSVFVFTFITHMYHVPYSYSTIKEVVRKPWLPLEVIETKTVRYVGYSIAVKDGWHAILSDDERKIYYVAATDVTQRQICKKASESLSQPAPLVDFSEKRLSVWRVCPAPSDR
jgi:hypothetical protein